MDTVNNILAMKVDMVVMRHPHPGAHHFLASKVDVPIVNAGDGTHEHPTQALLDTLSLRERLGEDLQGKNIAIVGDIQHSRVALSNIWALKLLGANVRICGPHTLIPKHLSGLGVEVSHDLDDTIRWADALNMLRIQLERQGPNHAVRYFPTLRVHHEFWIDTRPFEASQQAVDHHASWSNQPWGGNQQRCGRQRACHHSRPSRNGVAVRMAVLCCLRKAEGDSRGFSVLFDRTIHHEVYH